MESHLLYTRVAWVALMALVLSCLIAFCRGYIEYGLL